MEKQIKELGLQNSGPIASVVACDKCENTWLEQVRINRYVSRETPIGTALTPTLVDSDMMVLRCVLCGQIMIPSTDAYGARGVVYSRFAEMADIIDKVQQEKLNEPNRHATASKDA